MSFLSPLVFAIALIVYEGYGFCIKKGNNSGKNLFFTKLRKLFLDIHIRNFMSKLESSRLNGVAVIAMTYLHNTHTHTHTQSHNAELR